MWLTLFILSLTLNIFFLLYIRWLIKSFKDLELDIKSTESMIAEFLAHMNSIYELEMFYGDETLKNLLDHGKELTSKLSDIDFLIDEIEEDQEEWPEQQEENRDV